MTNEEKVFLIHKSQYDDSYLIKDPIDENEDTVSKDSIALFIHYAIQDMGAQGYNLIVKADSDVMPEEWFFNLINGLSYSYRETSWVSPFEVVLILKSKETHELHEVHEEPVVPFKHYNYYEHVISSKSDIKSSVPAIMATESLISKSFNQ